jgi:predicted DNA-binding ribbon-helix-helix protein
VNDSKVVNRTIRVDLDLWLTAKHLAGKEKRSVSSLITELLEERISQEPSKEGYAA